MESDSDTNILAILLLEAQYSLCIDSLNRHRSFDVCKLVDVDAVGVNASYLYISLIGRVDAR